uniref:Uncharacterized protein n=1 Tax=Cacopsylla melanoneura TaxID=428564 RepID=A0A8D8PV17_9HEMI
MRYQQLSLVITQESILTLQARRKHVKDVPDLARNSQVTPAFTQAVARPTPSHLTSKHISELTPGKSHTSVSGKAVDGSLLDQTNLPDTFESIPVTDLSNVTSVKELSLGQITYLYI